MKRKTFSIDIEEKRKDGGRIVINTAALDRDKDRVLPTGGKLDAYLANAVVLWGHNYQDAYAVVGKTTALEITPNGITADFELRPAANEQDPQNIVRLLWEGGWIKTASVGFIPNMAAAKENDEGGMDFAEWELLEWSLVPIPANQEALRLAVKGFTKQVDEQPAPIVAEVDTSIVVDTPAVKTEDEQALEWLAENGETLLALISQEV